MARHVWSVLCKRGLVDSQTNQVSLIDAVESIVIRGPRVPSETERVFVPVVLTAVTLWTRSDMAIPETMQGRVVVMTPDGVAVPGKALEIDLHSAPRARAFMGLASFPFNGPGEYQIAVETRADDGEAWRRNTVIPLQVSFEEMPISQRRVETNKRKARRRAVRR